MSLKNYLLTMTGASLLSWAIFIFVLNFTSPETTSWIIFALFYFSLFLSLSGIFTLLGFIIRQKMFHKSLAFYSVKASFRQSFLFSFLLIAILFMLAQNIFSWLNISLLIIILAIIEYILINEKKSL